jgi:hypothetical protein
LQMLDDRRLAPHISGVVEDRIAQEKDMAHTQFSTRSHEISAASGAMGSFGGEGEICVRPTGLDSMAPFSDLRGLAGSA